MQSKHSALLSALTGLALVLQHASASLSLASRTPQAVDIIVTEVAKCDHKSHKGDYIEVHYTGKLEDGTVFDSSYDHTKEGSDEPMPLGFHLGQGRVIEGWDEGLLDMCPGERRKLTIPPGKAYGSNGPGIIPPRATLTFETLLVSLNPASDDEEELSIQTAPARPPEAESTPAPKEEENQELGDHQMKHDTSLVSPNVKTYSAAIPTKLPDLPITGIEGASTAPAAVATQQPIKPPPGSDPDDEPGAVNGECRLLGPFALIVQAGLGLLAVSSLIFKRWRERPRRPFKIWFFDVSKQVVGSVLLHILNLLMSMFSSADFELAHKAQEFSASLENAQNKQVNPCSWYLINIAIDTTIGIPILVILLRLLHHGFSLTPLARPKESIKSGHYGQPPRATWWIKQSFIYFIGLVLMKLCVFFIIQLLPWIALVGDWALRWTEGNATLQVAFVMFVFPLIMNAIQYYIIDSFIKDASSGHERVPSDEQSSEGTHASYHSNDIRDSMESDDDRGSGTDHAKEEPPNGVQDSGSSSSRERSSPLGDGRTKDA